MANLELWRSPWRELNGWSKTMDRLMEDVSMAKTPSELNKYGFSPGCEIKEDRNAFYLKVDLPGVQKENVKIDLHDNRLMISGERTEEKKSEDKDLRIHFSEMLYGTFNRTVNFPTAVDAEKTEAKYESGVLQMTIPKKSGGSSRQINIK